MKSVLLLPIMLGILTSLKAQENTVPVDRNLNYLSISVGAGWNGSVGLIGKGELRYGRFLQKHWLAGVSFGTRKSKFYDQKVAGIFGRYYLDEGQQGFFLEASHQIGHATRNYRDPFSSEVQRSISGIVNQTFLGVGYAIVNKKNFGVEFFSGWEIQNMSRPLPESGRVWQGFNGGIRFQYRFK